MTDIMKELDDQFKEFVAEISDLKNWTKIQDNEYGVIYHFVSIDEAGDPLHYYYEIFTFELARQYVGVETLRSLYGPFDQEVLQEHGMYYLDESEGQTLVQLSDISEEKFFSKVHEHFQSNFNVIDPLTDPIENWES